MKLVATIYGETIRALSMTELKRKASAIANRRFNPIDYMDIIVDGKVAHFTRINQVTPWNTITRGVWR